MLANERPKLSAFVVAYNRQDVIGTTLKALGFVDELILIDKSSTDGTPRISEPLVDRLVVVPWTPTVEDTRVFACSLCTHEWILFLDDDECLTPEAVLFIDHELRAPRADIYRLPQRHHILGVHDEASYYWPEWQTRLFRRGTIEFSPSVHGGFLNLSEKVHNIPAEGGIAIMHLSHVDVEQWIAKTNRYTSQSDRLRAQDEGRDLVAFAHRSIDKWTAWRLPDDPGSYPEAVGLLRSIYDLIDRLKTWEEERGMRGEACFAAICLTLETRYALELGNLRRERSCGAKDLEVKHVSILNEASSDAKVGLLLRTNAALADILKATRLAGEDLRYALKDAHALQATLANELAQERVAAEGARAEVERECAARKALSEEVRSLRARSDQQRCAIELACKNSEQESSRFKAEAELLFKKKVELEQIRASLFWGPLRTGMKIEKTLRSLFRQRNRP